MKAEKRHELESNELAIWLERTIEKLKPYARAMVGVIVAVAIIIAVYAYVGALERRGATAAADQLLSAMQGGLPSDFKAIVDDHRGTQPAAVAQLLMGELELDGGANLLYADKLEGKVKLRKAAEAFALAADSVRDPMLRAWAWYGLGRAHESLGELDRARQDYEKLLKDFPDSSLVEVARTHLNHLKQPGVEEFYAWFAKQDPRPPEPDKSTGIPGLKPSFDLSEPSSSGDIKPGDFKLPEAGAPSGAAPEATWQGTTGPGTTDSGAKAPEAIPPAGSPTVPPSESPPGQAPADASKSPSTSK